MSAPNAINQFEPFGDPGEGMTIPINCPNCGARGVKGVVHVLVETYKVVIKHRTTWVKCSSCGYDLFSKVDAEQLRGRSPDELEGVIIRRVSLISRFFAIAAIVLCVAPIMGLIVAVLATIFNWKNRGWLKTVSLVALCISFVITAIVVGFMTFWHPPDEPLAHRPPMQSSVIWNMGS